MNTELKGTVDSVPINVDEKRISFSLKQEVTEEIVCCRNSIKLDVASTPITKDDVVVLTGYWEATLPPGGKPVAFIMEGIRIEQM